MLVILYLFMVFLLLLAAPSSTRTGCSRNGTKKRRMRGQRRWRQTPKLSYGSSSHWVNLMNVLDSHKYANLGDGYTVHTHTSAGLTGKIPVTVIIDRSPPTFELEPLKPSDYPSYPPVSISGKVEESG